MNCLSRLISGRCKLTVISVLALCLLTTLVFNAHSRSNFVSVGRLRAQSSRFLPSSKPTPKCSVTAYPGRPSRNGQKQLWNDVLGIFQRHAPLLDYIEQQTLVQYDRIEPLLPGSATEATRIRSIHESLVESVPPQPSGLFTGRGIVMVAGGSKSEYAATSIGMLRLVGSRLPIELWFVDRGVEKKGWCKALEAESVTCRYISDHIHNASSPTVLPYSDQYITAALLFSAFAEILFLDSDTLPVTNPDEIFASEEYQQNGMVVWPDFWGSTETPWALYTTGRIAEAEEKRADQGTLDTAQILLNKTAYWRTLILTTYYTHYASFFQRFLSTTSPSARGFGASLAAALAVLKAPFYRVPAGPDQVARSAADGTQLGGGVTVLHAAPGTNMPLFMHTSIIRFGIRELMCDASCIEDPARAEEHSERFGRPSGRQRMIGTKVRTMGAIASPGDMLHDALVEGRRLLSWKQLEEKGLGGFEGQVWRVLERTACQEESVWREEGVCKNIGGFVDKAIGAQDFVAWRGEC